MKYYLALLITLFSSNLEAKSDSAELKWSVGLRSGLVLRNVNLTQEYDLKSYNRAWENQLFVTKMIGKGFELDLSLGYQQKQLKGKKISMYDSATYYYHDKVQTIRTTLLLRYHFLKLNKTSVFVQGGINIAHNWVDNGNEIFYPTSYLPFRSYKWSTRSGSLQLGIGARNNFTKRLSAIGEIDVRYNEHLHLINGEQNYTNWSLCALVGIAYHL